MASRWDASAILSALAQDTHSRGAARWSGSDGLHLVSTLGWAGLKMLTFDRRLREAAESEGLLPGE